MTDIRRASPADLPALVAVFGQEPYFRRQLEAQARDESAFFVAWQEGVPVGDVMLRFEPPPEQVVREHLPGVPMISHLEVTPAHQRRGVATRLLAAAEALAWERGHPLVCLGCGVTNPARALYDGRGYVDWEFGEVLFEWAEPDPDSELCHVLIKSTDPDVPGLSAWRPWTPAEVAQRLSGCPVPWSVAGGWAVDLHLGRTTRAHSDVEIAIPRGELDRLRPYLRGLRLYDVGSGRIRPLPPGADPDPGNHQLRVGDADGSAYRMEVFLEPGTVERWVSHRDPRVTLPLAEAIRHTADAVPYLRPELVLFAKAKHRRPKDESDLSQLLPTLDSAARRWLAGAVSLAHPGHPWLVQLS